MLQLNNNVEDLPCLFYSPSTSSHMQKVCSSMDSEVACNILCMCPLKWQDQYHLLEKCYPGGVKPLLLILECIEVVQPVHETSAEAKPTKSQGLDQSTKKFTQGMQIPRKPKRVHSENMHVEKKCNIAKSMGMRTPRIIPQSATITIRWNSYTWNRIPSRKKFRERPDFQEVLCASSCPHGKT